MITEEKDRIIHRQETPAKTFNNPIYIWLGTAAVILGIYYFSSQFRPNRVEEWLPIGIIAACGAYILISNRAGWNIPGSKFRFRQREYVFDMEKDELNILFSSSTQQTRIETTVDLKGVESFDSKVESSSVTRRETRVMHESSPDKNITLSSTTPTGTYTQTRNRTYTTRKTFLVLEPLGSEIPLGGTPENFAAFIERLNEKLREIRTS